jgi:O-antigen/teichoic acid export membrane protein
MKSVSLFKGLSLLVFLNVLVKPVWIFFIDRQVQVFVGPEAYGSYFSVLNLSLVFGFLTDAGLANMVNQQLASGHAVSFRQLMVYKLSLSLLYILSVVAVALCTGVPDWTLLILVALIQILTSFFLLLRNVITAYQLFTTDAWLSVVDKALMILLAGGFLYLPFHQGISIYAFLYLQLITTCASIIIALLILFRRSLMIVSERISIQRMIRATFPFTVLILLMGVHYRLDGFLLERIYPKGTFEAGIYASAFRLLDATNMVGYLAASFLVPFIAKHLSDRPLVTEAVLCIRNILLTGCSLLVPLIWVFAGDIQRLLYHNTDAHAALVTRLCCLTLPGYFLTHVYGSALTATAKLYPFIRLVLVSVLINISLNAALIPTYGAVACCIAAVASQSFCGIGLYLTASRRIIGPFSVKHLLLCGATSALLFILFYAGKNAALNNWTLWTTGVFITGFAMFVQIPYFRKVYFKLN